MQLDLETFLSKTSPAGSTCPTTPSAVSWQDLLERMRLCSQQNAATGIGDTNHHTYPDLMASQRSVIPSAAAGCGNIADGRVRVWLPDLEDGPHGGFSTLNISEWPNDAAVCSLSQILERGPIPQRFFLSAKACTGILRRAEKRGKELPEQLARALRAVAGSAPTSTSTEDCSQSDSGGGNCSGPIDKAACLTAKGQRIDFEVETFIAEMAGTLPAGGNRTGGDRPPGMGQETADTMLIAHSLRGEGFDASEDGTGRGTPIVPVISGTLKACSGKSGTPNGAEEADRLIAYAIQAGALRENPDSGPDGIGVQEGGAYTLEARAEVQAVAFALRGRDGGAMPEIEGDGSRVGSLRAASGGSSRDYVATGEPVAFAQNQRDELRLMNIAGALAAEPGMKQTTYVHEGWQVRRLTPPECEALQGFPNGFTDIEYRGKRSADGPRYKSLGNSWAVPNGAWIIARIAERLAA